MPPLAGLPSLIQKRDGLLVPFEADEISQSVYAATEELGKPSAFLARELTDGVLHFLGAEDGAEPPTTEFIAELVAKVVRELGHPELAQIYAKQHDRAGQDVKVTEAPPKSAPATLVVPFSCLEAPDEVARRSLHAYSLQVVFGRDLAAAHEEGLIELRGLEYPDELARMLVGPSAASDALIALVNAPARTLIFDSPERYLGRDTAKPWIQNLATLCESTGRRAIVNLQVTPPPAWAHEGVSGPLFGDVRDSFSEDGTTSVAELLCTEIQGRPCLRADWHVSDVDLTPDRFAFLEALARKAAAAGGAGFAFTFDRPKKAVGLAAGMDRAYAAALLDVGLVLPRFLGMSGVAGDVRLFLAKLPSLARMAVRAGIQKRNFLRGRSRAELARGFLLERARLVVIPLRLDEVVRTLLGQSIAESKATLDLARQIVQVLCDTLRAESLAANIEIAVDGPEGEFPGISAPLSANHVHTAGILHGLAGFGTVACAGPALEQIVEQLPQIFKKTEVARIGG